MAKSWWEAKSGKMTNVWNSGGLGSFSDFGGEKRWSAPFDSAKSGKGGGGKVIGFDLSRY